jgi:SAM-dependent methyltransferase
VRNPGVRTKTLAKYWYLRLNPRTRRALRAVEEHASRQVQRFDAVEAANYVTLPLLSMRMVRKLTGLREGDLRGKTVLDVGTGTGENLDIIERHEPGAKTIGLDSSEHMLKSERHVGKPRQLILSDSGGLGGRIKLRDGASFLTTCHNVLDVHENPRGLIKELSRVTEPDGHVLLSYPWPFKPSNSRPADRIPMVGFDSGMRDLAEVARDSGLELRGWTDAERLGNRRTVTLAFRKVA